MKVTNISSYALKCFKSGRYENIDQLHLALHCKHLVDKEAKKQVKLIKLRERNLKAK